MNRQNFVMELPAYHWPRAKDILIHTWERARGFIVKAGTIIFLASGLVWLLQSFDFSFEMVDAQDSMMAVIGHYLAPVFAPLGFDSWQTAFAAITGFLAKEVVVSTFGILAGVAEATEEDPTLIYHYSKHVHACQCVCIYDFYIAGISVFCCYWRDQARDGQLALDFLCPPISNRLGILHGFADIPDRQQNVMTVL